jgi:LCP family protein required for cell wall assembly
MKKRIILVTAALVLFALIGYGAYTVYQITHPETLFNIPTASNETPEPTPAATASNTPEPTASQQPEAEPTEEPEEEVYQFAEKRLNILMMGLDASTERYEEMKSFRTDTLMLASIDFAENKVFLISIPRDSYVHIPGRKQMGRVNAAFVYGGGFEGNGFATTIQTVGDFLGGIPIHFYAAVDMNLFKKIIDDIGGVTYDVDIPVVIAGRRLEPGLQTLTGQQAMDYARIRNTGGGDIDRVDRQQRLMLAVFDQLKSTNTLTKLPRIYESVKEDVWTDLNVKQIAALCYFAAKLGTENIDRRMVPGNYLNIDGVSYWGIDQKKKNALVNEVFGLNITEFVLEDDVNYLRQQVQANLAEKVQLAHQWIQTTTETLVKYDSVLLESEKTQLNDGIAAVNHALGKGNRPKEIAAAAQALEEVHNSITAGLEQRKAHVASAEAVLSAIGAELPAFSARLQPADQDTLHGKMNFLREKITLKKFGEISPAAEDLNQYWSSLKQKSQQQPEESKPPETEAPNETDPTQEGTPAEGASSEQPPQSTNP